MADSRILDGDGTSHLIGLIKQGMKGLQDQIAAAVAAIKPDGETLTESDGTWSVKPGGIGTDEVADGSITEAKLADGILSGGVADGSVTVDKLADEFILPVSKGGTGATTAAQARTNLGITASNINAAPATHTHAASDITSGAIPVSHGGTGATSIDGARTVLFNFPSNSDLLSYLGIDSSQASGSDT